MRLSIRQLIQLCDKHFSLREPIYEFGSYQVPGHEKTSNLRPLFAGKHYIGADMRQGPGVDLVLDLHEINLPSSSAGTVLILDTMEHVENPRAAMAECHRILKSDGILIMSSVMNFPIHDHPFDFWRYTPDGFRSLLKVFEFGLVDYAGRIHFPHTIIAVGFKSKPLEMEVSRFSDDLKIWKRKWSSPFQDMLMFFYPYMPASILNFYRRMEARIVRS